MNSYLARTLRHAFVVGLALVAVLTSEAAAASPHLGARDVNRLNAANSAAFLANGLITQRNCDPDALPCIKKATTKEIAVVRRAADVAKALLPKLTKGPCRQAVAAAHSSYNKRAGLIAKARNAWQGHHYHAASQAYYYVDWRSDLINVVATRCSG